MSGHETERYGRNSAAGDGRARQVQGAVCGPVCVEAGTCSCGADHGAARPAAAAVAWVPAECTLPVVEQPVRVAEFDALFAGAVRAVQRLEPVRLCLVLDRMQEAAARDLAARESGCCSLFTFTFVRNGDDGLRWEISVPEDRVWVLDALADRATAALRKAAR